MPRRAPRRDQNERSIVEALRKAGASVQYIDERGCPDLMVGHNGKNYWIEVKLPAGPKGGMKDRKLTTDQLIWYRDWKGQAAVVHTPLEALAVLGLI